MDEFSQFSTLGRGKDCVVYAALCEKLDGGASSVALKVYEKAKISAIKHRSVRREARIMRYLTDKRCATCVCACVRVLCGAALRCAVLCCAAC
jgi:hypothetical protein